jgi:hypothetical protein
METVLLTLFSIGISLTHSIGITLGVGASTFAILLFLRALSDGVIDASERHLLGAVYMVLRIAMVLIALPLIILSGIWIYQGAGQLLLSPIFLIEWTILAVIVINAILMTKKKMPMWLGPAIAGGSWYSMFLVVELPLGQIAYPLLIVYYIAFVLLFFAAYTMLRKRYAPKLHTGGSPAAHSEHTASEMSAPRAAESLDSEHKTADEMRT